MKLKKINKFAEKRAKALYIYLQALWENKQEKACYTEYGREPRRLLAAEYGQIQDPDYKKREAENSRSSKENTYR